MLFRSIEYELRIRLNRRDRELDPPRKTYNSDLVYHYQMGVSSGIPYMEYISYYHVIEHFMDKIFHEDFVNQIRRKLTDPGFSYNRDKDIKQLIKVMGDRIKIQKGEVRFDEKEALKLTLKKYLDIENLKTSISEFSEPLLEYY